MTGKYADFFNLVLNNFSLVLAVIPLTAFLIGFAVDLITKRRECCPLVSLPGKRVKRYADRRRTPLGWHRFTQFVLLPGWMLGQAYALRYTLFNVTKEWALRIGASTLPLSAFIMLAIAFVAFLRWHRMGSFWYAAFFLCETVYAASLLIYMLLRGFDASANWMNVLLYLEWLLVTVFYYRRRELLFTAGKAADRGVDAPSVASPSGEERSADGTGLS